MTETEKKYYLGGYYLTKLVPKDFEPDKGSLLYTCSYCINDHLLDIWSYSWTTNNNKDLEEIKKNYQLSDTQIVEIRNWVDDKYNDNKIGWLDVFIDLETAYECKNKFFSHLSDIKMFALYFDQEEREAILKEFKSQSEKEGEFGLCLTLLKEMEEQDNEEFLGYDYIGIEVSGTFHSFQCHDLGKEFSKKFNLTINDYNLFDSDANSKQVLSYLNNEKNGFTPVPWHIVKTKLVINK